MTIFAMRSALLRCLALASASAVLAACAGGAMPPSAPQSAGRLSPAPLGRAISGIYVADIENNDVAVFNGKTYKQIETITDGIYEPDGEWVDAKGNLYVVDANSGYHEVQEYAPGQTSPKTTYSAGLTNPIRVKVDAHGNVYAVDWNNGHLPTFINEYAQGSNKVKYQYKINEGVEDVAFDKSGNMYVNVVDISSGLGFLFEFPRGSHKYRQRAVTTGWPSAMAFDSKANLLIGDETYQSIDIIPPPYSKIASTLPGFSLPYNLALNASGTKLVVVDRGSSSSNPVVDVLEYPSGKLLKKLDSANGLGSPYGVAVSPEFQ